MQELQHVYGQAKYDSEWHEEKDQVKDELQVSRIIWNKALIRRVVGQDEEKVDRAPNSNADNPDENRDLGRSLDQDVLRVRARLENTL